jgi:hypothetical protein
MEEPKDWKYKSPDTSGFHTVIDPQNSLCKQTHIFRLNLEENQTHGLCDEKLELNGVVIEGTIEIKFGGFPACS